MHHKDEKISPGLRITQSNTIFTILSLLAFTPTPSLLPLSGNQFADWLMVLIEKQNNHAAVFNKNSTVREVGAYKQRLKYYSESTVLCSFSLHVIALTLYFGWGGGWYAHTPPFVIKELNMGSVRLRGEERAKEREIKERSTHFTHTCFSFSSSSLLTGRDRRVRKRSAQRGEFKQPPKQSHVQAYTVQKTYISRVHALLCSAAVPFALKWAK